MDIKTHAHCHQPCDCLRQDALTSGVEVKWWIAEIKADNQVTELHIRTLKHCNALTSGFEVGGLTPLLACCLSRRRLPVAPNTTLPAFALPAVPFAEALAAEDLAWASVK